MNLFGSLGSINTAEVVGTLVPLGFVSLSASPIMMGIGVWMLRYWGGVGTSWCGHCNQAQPHLAAAFEDHGQVRHWKSKMVLTAPWAAP